MKSIEQITLTLIKAGTEQQKSLPDIIDAIALGKSRVALFARIVDGPRRLVVPMHHLIYFDQIRKAMVDVIRYMRDNLETMDPWFRGNFTKEDLEMMLTDITSVIERSAERPENVRAFHSGELKIYQEFFNSALIGIIGPERFQKYAIEFNRCANTLRQIQIECRSVGDKIGKKES